MKKIVDLCERGMRHYQVQDIIKLRLRGQGSSFKEGHSQQEPNDPQHLCVSSKCYEKFLVACVECEKLLGSVCSDTTNGADIKDSLCPSCRSSGGQQCPGPAEL